MDDLPPIKLNADVIEKLKTELSSTSYREAIKNSSTYNNRLVVERKTRLPFIDSQTGVAQNDCYLWMQKWERMPGQIEGQVYSYPVRRWKKKRRQYLLNNVYPSMNGMKTENQSESGYEQNGLNGVENVPHHDESQDSKYFADKDPGNSWMSEYDDTAVELPDAGELDGEQDSDFDDYEEYTTSRKKKRKKAESGRKKKAPVASVGGDPSLEKPYQCDICKMRYKTRPGLTYHYSHNHPNEAAERRVPSAIAEEEDSQQSLGATSNNGVSSRTSQTNSSSNSPLPPLGGRMTNAMASALPAHLLNPGAGPGSVPSSPIPGNNGNAARFNNGEMSKDGTKQKKSSAPSNYCDFCLGNSEINKKTKMSEEMISCSDCGRSAHPTCLQFTANMLLSVKKYRWQCLECKSCGLCGTSDNDDQLLFCDDCDRGYHMYCLQPPLSEPPEGSWSCHLCIEEYHKPKVASSNDSMMQVEPQSQLVKQPQTDNLTENNTSAPTPSTPTPAQLTVPPIASTGP